MQIGSFPLNSLLVVKIVAPRSYIIFDILAQTDKIFESVVFFAFFRFPAENIDRF